MDEQTAKDSELRRVVQTLLKEVFFLIKCFKKNFEGREFFLVLLTRADKGVDHFSLMTNLLDTVIGEEAKVSTFDESRGKRPLEIGYRNSDLVMLLSIGKIQLFFFFYYF